MTIFWIAVLILVTYFLGAIPFALVVSRFRGVDLRKVGSGNIGATNVYRAMGLRWAILVFLLDAFKGFLPTLIAILAFPHFFILHVFICFLAIFAHSYTPFAGFKGGKGAATGLGVLLALSPIVFGIAAVIAVVIIGITRYVSVGTMTCSVLIPVFLYMFSYPKVYVVFISVICFFVIYRHKPNIVRLMQGTENKI